MHHEAMSLEDYIVKVGGRGDWFLTKSLSRVRIPFQAHMLVVTLKLSQNTALTPTTAIWLETGSSKLEAGAMPSSGPEIFLWATNYMATCLQSCKGRRSSHHRHCNSLKHSHNPAVTNSTVQRQLTGPFHTRKEGITQVFEYRRQLQYLLILLFRSNSWTPFTLEKKESHKYLNTGGSCLEATLVPVHHEYLPFINWAGALF